MGYFELHYVGGRHHHPHTCDNYLEKEMKLMTPMRVRRLVSENKLSQDRLGTLRVQRLRKLPCCTPSEYAATCNLASYVACDSHCESFLVQLVQSCSLACRRRWVAEDNLRSVTVTGREAQHVQNLGRPTRFPIMTPVLGSVRLKRSTGEVIRSRQLKTGLLAC